MCLSRGAYTYCLAISRCVSSKASLDTYALQNRKYMGIPWTLGSPLSLFSPWLVLPVSLEERSPLPLLTLVCVWVAGDLLSTDGARTVHSYPGGSCSPLWSKHFAFKSCKFSISVRPQMEVSHSGKCFPQQAAQPRGGSPHLTGICGSPSCEPHFHVSTFCQAAGLCPSLAHSWVSGCSPPSCNACRLV